MSAPASTPPKVFVSFAFANKDEATKVVAALKAAGLETWYCVEELQAGDVFDRQIHGNINDCHCGVLLLSTASAKSDECLSEWRYVLSRGKKLYLARLADLSDADFLYRLRIYQYADLGKDFDAGLAALVKAVQAQTDLDPAAPTTGQALRTAGRFPSWQLIRPLVGRAHELADVSTWLAGPRTVVLTGTGGVGKTKLAAEVAVRSALPDGVVWYVIPAADTPEKAEADLDQLTSLLREHLGLPPTDRADTVWAKLGAAGLLLVLDNAEDCQHPQPYLARLDALSHAGGTQVLITSRVVWPGLRSAHPIALDPPPPDEAVEILREIVRGNLPKPKWPTDAALARLPEAAHYHPRLMELASGWLNDQPAADVEAMLRDLPTLRDQHDPDIDAALHELIGKTLLLMRQQPGGEVAYQSLRRLVVCRGGFSPEAAKALLPEGVVSRTPLGLLGRWNLLRFDGTRYDTDPLVRDAVAPDPTAYPAHLAFYQALVNQHNKQQDYLGLDPESANLEAAFEWALRAEEVKKAYWLANACYEFLLNRGRQKQSLIWLQRVEQALPKEASDELRAKLNNNLGNAYLGLSAVEEREANLRRAIAAYHEALRFRTPATAPLDYAATQNNLGNAYLGLSAVEEREANLRRAIAAYHEALRFRTPATAPLYYATTQNNLGAAYADLSKEEEREANLRRAIAAYHEALRFWLPVTAPLDYAMTQNNLGTAYWDLSAVEEREANLRRAIAAYHEALRFRTPATAPLNYAGTQNNLGIAYRGLSAVEEREANLRRAIAAYHEALRFSTPATAPLNYAMTQENMGIVYEDLGDLSTAITCWQNAERQYRRMGDTTNADLMLAWIADAQARLPTPQNPSSPDPPPST